MKTPNWEIWKLAHAYPSIGSGTTPTSTTDYYYSAEVGVPWVTTAELRENYIEKTASNVTKEALQDFSALRVYQPGSLMIAMYGATIGRLGITMMPATCNQACCVFEYSEQFDNRFLFYWLWHRRSDLIALSTGGGQPNLSQQDLREERAYCPPLETQRRIAQFLDEKTARIDGLIEKKRALLDRLAEKRQALITRTVTSGIDDFTDVSARETRKIISIKEIGEVNFLHVVPAHWIKTSVGKYCDVQLGKMLQSDPASEKDKLKRYLRAINIAKHGLDIRHEFSMWIKPQEMQKFRLQRGDILVSEGGDAGRTAVFDCEEEFYFQNAINRVRPVNDTKILSKFIYYWFVFLKMAGYVEMVCNVATIPHFTAEKVKAAPLALPPLDIQCRIAHFLDVNTANIDKQAVQIEKSIALLNEYRSALITAAVTGQIEGLQ